MTKEILMVPFIAVFLLVIAAKTVRVVKDDERLVVFRLGRLLNVYPPGKAILIPFIDQGTTDAHSKEYLDTKAIRSRTMQRPPLNE